MIESLNASSTNTWTESLAEDWLAAWNFAAEVHNTQKVPGTALPYLKHLGMVAMEVFSAHAMDPIADLGLAVRCAILHDTIEDQDVTHSQLVTRFGLRVANGVLALSKNSELSKSEAMADSLRRIREQPQEVWCVKLADRISNLNGAPPHWSAEKRATYRVEAQQILDALGSAHAGLAQRLAAKILAYSSE
jgi:(p)ppGpp synthase/HD superfamily hydrolase